MRAAVQLLGMTVLAGVVCGVLCRKPAQAQAVVVTGTKAQDVVVMGAMANACPVGFSAGPGVGPGMVVQVDAHTGKAYSMQENLFVRNTQRLGITDMQVTVHGLSPDQPMWLPIGGATKEPLVDTHADLKLVVAAGAKGQTGLLVRGITAVKSIDLDAVAYADGSMWHAPKPGSCRVVPAGAMLVGGEGQVVR